MEGAFLMPAQIAFVDGATSITTQADYEDVRDAFIEAWNPETEIASVKITTENDGPQVTINPDNVLFVNEVENDA